MKIEKVELFRTEDGKTFNNEAAAKAHLAAIAECASIDAYIKHAGLTSRTAVTVRRHLLDYTMFKENHAQRA